VLSIPEKLCDRALALGLICDSNEQQHSIQPSAGGGSWHLTYQQGYWVLIVRGVPQLNFGYEEALRFLDRLALSSGRLPQGKSLPQAVH
jgi:hypothetical protein